MIRVGSDNISKIQRRGLTLACFVIVFTLTGSMSIYTDTLALQQWDTYTAVGPVAMKVKGVNVESIVDDVMQLPEVTSVSTVQKARAYLRMDQDEIFQGSPDNPMNPVFLVQGFAYSLNEDFLTSFPTRFTLVTGRWPQNSSEITIAYNDALFWNIPIGRMMNYTHTLNGEKRTVFVVGFFTQPEADAVELYATNAVVIVTPEVLNPETKSTEIFLDIDKSILSPADGRGSLSILQALENKILEMDPTYTPESPYSDYLVENYIIAGVREYLEWLNAARIRQIQNSQGVILLIGMLSLLAIRFNLSSRKHEQRMLFTRGATSRRITGVLLGEIIVLAIVACIIGLIFGVGVSRFAYASTGFLVFDWSASNLTLVLVTYDTFTFQFAISLIVPLSIYVINQRTLRKHETDVVEQGRLARVTRTLKMVQWDLVLLVFAFLFLVALFLGGNTVRTIPVLMFMFTFMLLPVFLGVASLISKILDNFMNIMSKGYKRITDRSVSFIGIRRIGRRARYTSPVILVIGVTLCLVLNSLVISESIPQTQVRRTSFMIGADVTFHLDNDYTENWTSMFNWAMSHVAVTGSCIVSTGTVTFSEGSAGQVDFIAFDPNEYVNVGYSHSGIGLAESSLANRFDELESNEEGAIITQDVADIYDLRPGDSIRAFTINGLDEIIEFDVIDVTSALSSPNTVNALLSDEGITLGQNKIWINRAYLSGKIDLNITAENYLCIKIAEGQNGTILGNEFLGEFGSDVLEVDGWSSVTHEVDALVSQFDFRIDRAIDSMLVIVAISSIVLALVIYRIQGNDFERRETAVLRTIGANRYQLHSTRFVELLALAMGAILIVTIFGPILITNSLETGVVEYAIWSFIFPVGPNVLITVEMLGFILFYIMIPIAFVTIVSLMTLDKNISSSLEAVWTKHGIEREGWS